MRRYTAILAVLLGTALFADQGTVTEKGTYHGKIQGSNTTNIFRLEDNRDIWDQVSLNSTVIYTMKRYHGSRGATYQYATITKVIK